MALEKIILFASGEGTGFQSLLENVKAKKLNVSVLGLVCNKPGAPVIEKARKLEVPTLVVPHSGKSREDHEKEILNRMYSEWKITPSRDESIYFVLCGYMRLFSPLIIETMWSQTTQSARIVNIHPSLLPSFPGVDSYKQAFDHGVKVTGATVHFVEKEMDSGPIIMQRAFSIEDGDSLEDVKRKGHELEHQLYVDALSKLKTWGKK